jgi:hypothetical protein
MDYLFASESLGPLLELRREIAAALGGDDRFETYRKMADFSARLRRHNRPGIMILLLASESELAEISSQRDLVADAETILLLPDGAEQTFALAHSLRPNFLGSTDCDLDTVVSVLKRLVEKRARQPGQSGTN